MATWTPRVGSTVPACLRWATARARCCLLYRQVGDCQGQAGCQAGLARVEAVWSHGVAEGRAQLTVFYTPREEGGQAATEVVFLVRGRKHGLGMVYIDPQRRYLAIVTRYTLDIHRALHAAHCALHAAHCTRWGLGERVGPTWDLSMGHGLDMSNFFKPLDFHKVEHSPTEQV